MANAILDFPAIVRTMVRPVLVQLKLNREFVNAIEAWRQLHSPLLPRTVALVRLASLGLAGEALSKARRRRRT
jgi:hypothetical protein